MAGYLLPPKVSALLAMLVWLGMGTAMPLAALGQDAEPVAPVDPAVAAEAPDPSARPAARIRLRLPLAGDADASFRAVAERVAQQLRNQPTPDGQRPVLVVELVPADDRQGRGTDFARAWSVARYLTSDKLSGIKTVAYLSTSIRGHGVLVALACEEIAAAPDVEFGEASIDEDSTRPIDRAIVASYRQIAEARRTAPIAIALGMVDRELEVVEVETESSIQYLTRDQVAEIEARETVIRESTLFAAGTLGGLSAREARQAGVVKFLADDLAGLARGLSVRSTDLADEDWLTTEWNPVVYDIQGPINRQTVRYARTLLEREVASGANWIALRIDSDGGEPRDCQQLVADLRSLGRSAAGERMVRTVAYVPRRAAAGAALVALACDQLVMHPDAMLGGPGGASSERPAEEVEPVVSAIRDSIGSAPGRPWSLLAATIDPGIELFEYTHAATGELQLLSPTEHETLADKANWNQGPAVKETGAWLEMDAAAAERWGLVRHMVGSYDELQQAYGLTVEPKLVQPTWTLQLADALASPGMQVLLLVLAFVGIYIELQAPGIGLGGFLAAFAMLLFFWSKGLAGTVEWLEILLFVGGVLSILLEVFVLPGLGVFGIGGALMVIAAVILAGQRTLIPQSAADWSQLEQSLLVIMAATAGMVAAAVALHRLLPGLPVVGSLLLSSPKGEELAEIASRERLTQFDHLVGKQGVATTKLMPSGKAEFEGELVDVISAGEAIERGTPVQVVEVRGSRVRVKSLG